MAERLERVQGGGGGSQDKRRYGEHGEYHCEYGYDDDDQTGKGANALDIGRARELLDLRGEAGVLLETLGDVKRCLLLFFGAGRTRAYFFRQVFGVFH